MRKVKIIVKYLLSVFFVLAGLNHFLHTTFYISIMPSYVPWHFASVLVSGLAEIALGILLVIRRTTRVAAWGLILLLIAVFPANIHMAVNHELFPEFSAVGLWLRLPLQLVFIALCYWNTSTE